MKASVSIVIPAKNEALSIGELLQNIAKNYPDLECIVVDDGSTDETAKIATQNGAKVYSHALSMGNGASIKTGARFAKGDILVFMDADGQHDPEDISKLLQKMEENFEMVIGARQFNSQGTLHRKIANLLYNRLASIMTGYRIKDLTSGFRAARARHFKKFLYLLPNGFSYPTTSTMAFLRSGLPIAYVPIKAHKRQGSSHISLFKDGLRFFIIILKIGALFSPMRLFLPISACMFLLGIGYYGYTYFSAGRFTNMGVLFFISSIITFLIGIVSEQISSLHYKGVEEDRRVVKR